MYNNEPLRILLADDDEGDRLIFKAALEELEIKPIVHILNGGLELMAYLTKRNVRLPEIVFLDLNMPGKNGLECLKEMRRNKKLKDISIAIYSTSDSEKDMEDTFSNGANVYITKPADFSILKLVLKKAVLTASQYKDQSMKRNNFLLKI